MAEYYVTQNYAGLKAGSTLRLEEKDFSEQLARGLKAGILEELKPVKKAAAKVEEVSGDGETVNKSAE